MTWLVWRQHRAEALAAALMVAILAVAMMPTGLHLWQLAGQLRQGGCLGGSPGVGCGPDTDAFNATSEVVTYQPASRFWLFQGIEAAICLAAALTALAVAYRMVTRRRT